MGIENQEISILKNNTEIKIFGGDEIDGWFDQHL